MTIVMRIAARWQVERWDEVVLNQLSQSCHFLILLFHDLYVLCKLRIMTSWSCRWWWSVLPGWFPHHQAGTRTEILQTTESLCTVGTRSVDIWSCCYQPPAWHGEYDLEVFHSYSILNEETEKLSQMTNLDVEVFQMLTRSLLVLLFLAL